MHTYIQSAAASCIPAGCAVPFAPRQVRRGV